MQKLLRLPIRVKILITVLFLVTGVVAAITFTMANMFHKDKKAYIQKVASLVALATAEECRSILTGYEERLRMYGRIMLADEVVEEDRTELLRDLFQDFPELVAITLRMRNEEVAAVFNSGALDLAGVTRDKLVESLSLDRLSAEQIVAGEAFVANSTLSEKMPTLTLAVAADLTEPAEPVLITAVIRVDEIRNLTGRSKGFDVSLVSRQGVFLADIDLQQVVRRRSARLHPDVAPVQKGLTAGLSLEYVQDGEDMVGAFAAVDFGGVIARAQIPRSSAFMESRELLRQLMAVALALLVLSTGLGLMWARRITRPVERLSDATVEIAQGRFDIEVDVRSRDEIGVLAGSFNKMASELQRREMALQESQKQLIQSEKMAAFGQLGAGIAHEVKNPLAGILGCAQISLRKLERGNIVHTNLELIEKETRRCKTIIENLLKFARQEKAVLELTNVNSVVADTAAIVGHQLDMHKVKLEQDLGEDVPLIRGNANQLQQVLMNLMINAQQAMEGHPGTIEVVTRRDGEQLEISIRDTGPGIPSEIRDKLFEPFFTTKPGGKGTGLGLSVSFGIIQEHGGSIACDSAPGEGSTFTIRLPAVERQPEPVPVLA